MELSNPTRVELDPTRPATGSSPAVEPRNDPKEAVAPEREGAAVSGTAPSGRCAHNGLAMIHRVVGGYVARCLACQAIGPVWVTSEKARKALLEPKAPDRAQSGLPR